MKIVSFNINYTQVTKAMKKKNKQMKKPKFWKQKAEAQRRRIYKGTLWETVNNVEMLRMAQELDKPSTSEIVGYP